MAHHGHFGSLAHDPTGVSGNAARLPIDLALLPVARLGLKEHHRVVARDCFLDHPVSVVRGSWAQQPKSGSVSKVCFRALLVMLDGADVSAVGNADDNGHRERALVARGQLRQLRGDLVEAGKNKTVELDFTHGAESAHREPNGGTHDARFSQWSVEHSLVAELRLQTFGDAEDSAERANVFAHQQHSAVRSHRCTKSLVEGFRHCHRFSH